MNPNVAPLFVLFTLSSFCVLLPCLAQFDGYATHFDSIGTPYGGCGVPSNVLESQDYVALNVQKTPGNYGNGLPRPITNPAEVGEFNNGLNCGRWLLVTLGDYCEGVGNSGAPGSGFCNGGKWVSDEYNGASLHMLVTDSCQDGNEWCRDSQYHLDLHTESVPNFYKDGKPIGSGIWNSWNNRQISWVWSNPPAYSGDLKIGFLQNAQPQYYVPIGIANLPNGITGVERDMSGNWVAATMISDLGQNYVLPQGSGPFTIRVKDLNGNFVGNKIYTFNYPSSCGGACPSAWTEVSYTTEDLDVYTAAMNSTRILSKGDV